MNNYSFKRQNSQSLGDIIQEIINKRGMQPKLDEATVVSKWEEIVGKMIAKHTIDLFIKNKQLFIKFDSAALKQEISYAKTKLITNVNTTVGHVCIEEIVLL